MKTSICCDNLILFSILAAGLLLLSAVFILPAYAAEGDPTQEQIDSALTDLSAATGQTIGTKEAAIQVCDSEKYFTVCADIGKKHNLYHADEIEQVDSFVSEIKGNIASQLQSCQTTECLVGIASELAQKLSVKSSTLASNFDLTPKLIEKKQAVVTAAKELGVNFDECYKMDPDNAPIELLRACAKLAKDSRVRDTIPESVRQSVEGLAGYNDKVVEFRSSLATGEFQCGDGTLNGCGNFCLNPSKETRAQGTAGIPSVCRDIAKKFFGSKGEKELESAYSKVGQAQDFYFKKAESVVFKTVDGKTLTSLDDIGNYMESQGKQGNVEAVEKGMDFMIAKGFVKPEEKDYALKFVRKIRESGGIPDFESCAQNPESCRDFIPDDHKAEFEIGVKIDQIMRQEIGFDPRQCSRGEFDPSIGQKCFEGSKKALSKLEALAAQSQEARGIVEEIRGHISRGDEFERSRGQVEQAFRSQGGPGGCKSEQECFTFCSNPTNVSECISFGAKQGIFRGDEAVQKFQQFNNTLQVQQLPTAYVRQAEQNQYQQGFPGQGYGAQGGFPGQGYGVQGSFPGGGYPGGFPGQGGYPGGFPGQGGFPGGGFPGGGFPGQFGGPVGPSPECFAAIQSGDFARAKTACSGGTARIEIDLTHSNTGTPLPSNLAGICPRLPSIDSCPSGYKKVISFSSPECGTFYSCQQDYSAQPSCPGGYHWEYNTCRPDYQGNTYSPYPTGGTYSPYPTGGYTYTPYPSCPSGQWWDNARNTCVSGTYSPYPTGTSYSSCSQSLINLLGAGCHQMYSDSSGRYIFCNSEMNKSAKEGDTSTTAGCTGPSGGTYSPYPTGSYQPTYSPYPTGGTYSPYPTGPAVGSCSQSLVNLLGTGCHQMYSDSSGRYIFCNSEMTKSAKEGDTSTTAGCTGPSGGTYSPYPTGSYTYTPAPSCPSGQWWDYSRNACVSSTSTYSPYPTSTSSCPSGSHVMGSNCMSDSDTTKCGPFGSTSVSSFVSCSGYQSTYSPYPTSTYTYSPSPTTTGSSSCPSGSHVMGSNCMSDSDTTKCGPLGSTSVSSFVSCSGYQSTTTYISSPYPTYSSTYTYTPASSCPSGQYWNGSSCVSSGSTTTYTPYPTSTFSPTPYPTTESTTTTYAPPATTIPTTIYIPPATSYTPPAGSSPPPSGFDFKAHQMATARTIMACSDSGGSWNAGASTCASKGGGFFANVLKVFSKFIIGR